LGTLGVVALAAVVELLVGFALRAVVGVVLGPLPPHALSSAPPTSAPTSSRYGLRVIWHPGDFRTADVEI
jgi:hypothetical protein